MAQYLVRKGKFNYEIAKFDDSSSPTEVYLFSQRGCGCPARSKSCKHTRIVTAWTKAGRPVGAVYDDSANLINTLL
jgi:hypothetical protein